MKPLGPGQQQGKNEEREILYNTPGGCHTQSFKPGLSAVTCVCNTNLCNVPVSPAHAMKSVTNPDLPLGMLDSSGRIVGVGRPPQRDPGHVTKIYGVSGKDRPAGTDRSKPSHRSLNQANGLQMGKLTILLLLLSIVVLLHS